MRVLVNVLKILLVGVWVRVWLPVMAVFVVVLDVLVIVQDVRVGVRHVCMRVLMGVLLHRLSPFLPYSLSLSRFPQHYAYEIGYQARCYMPEQGYRQAFSIMHPYCS